MSRETSPVSSGAKKKLGSAKMPLQKRAKKKIEICDIDNGEKMTSRHGGRDLSIGEFHEELFGNAEFDSEARSRQDDDSDKDLWDSSSDSGQSWSEPLEDDLADLTAGNDLLEQLLIADDDGQAGAVVGDADENVLVAGEIEKPAGDESILETHSCMHELDLGAAADEQWTIRNDPNPPPDFTAVPGLVKPPPDDADIAYFTRMYLCEELFELLVDQTNLYAQQRIGGRVLKQNSFEYH